MTDVRVKAALDALYDGTIQHWRHSGAEDVIRVILAAADRTALAGAEGVVRWLADTGTRLRTEARCYRQGIAIETEDGDRLVVRVGEKSSSLILPHETQDRT